ncbi:MAG: mandelate racemase/muconate lactonizing enzyme family protein [Pseudomonadota bacterium]
MTDLSFTVLAVRATALAFPLERPLRSALGSIDVRPALVVEIDIDGAKGAWTGSGEVFSNFPPFSNRHKARIVSDLIAPRLTGQTFADPAAMTASLQAATHKVALQSGEFGPFAHTVAGLDVAAWDALARRADVPLWRLLTDAPDVPPVRAYASGLDGPDLNALVPPLAEAGWGAYKLKVGFDADTDARHLAALRGLAGDATLMVDANQAYEMAEARDAVTRLADEGLAWIEEPIRADSPLSDWRELVAIGAPLAAGENLRGAVEFAAAIDTGIAVIQPDAIKWGGLSGVRDVARMALAAGRAWAPHYLAGGIGLAASAHLAAALQATYLEVDVNPNPLREQLLGDAFRIEGGRVRLSERPGHGAVPNGEIMARYQVR